MWEDAAYELRQSRPLNIKGLHEKVFACLKLSYDQFQNEESKLCYLYCSLFPEDDDIEIESLLRYGLGEGLFSDVETVDEARNRVHSIVSNLKASCLFLNGTQTDSAKMHAIYRTLAISIATSDDYCFMVKAGSGLKDWPSNPKLEYVMRMSLIDNDLTVLSCPVLKSLPFGSKSLQKILQLKAERKWFQELKLESSEARAFLQNRFTDSST